jgi:hypothetical protein
LVPQKFTGGMLKYVMNNCVNFFSNLCDESIPIFK